MNFSFLNPSNWFRGSSNAGKQNKPLPDITTRPVFQKRTDYASFALSDMPNPYLEAVLNEMISNSVGGNGISITPQPITDDGKIDKNLQEQLKQLWRKNKNSLDAGGRHKWAELNALIAREVFGGGECFIIKWSSKNIKNSLNFGFMLKSYCAVPFFNTGSYRDGIDCDFYGQVKSYLFQNGTNYKPVKAKNVIHCANYIKCEDSRGFCAVAAACDLSVELDLYDKDASTLIEASTRMTYWVVSKDTPTFASKNVPIVHVKGLPTDVDIKSLSSQLTNTYSKEHRRNIHRSMCAAVGTGFGSVSGEFEGSYSASRQEMIVAAQKDLARQTKIINDAIQPIYEAFVLRCLTLGLLTEYRGGDLLNARYVAPHREHIDPLKQAKAVALELATNQTTLADVLASKGKDFDQHIIHLRDELEKLESAGLQPNGIEALKWLQLNAENDDSDENKAA